MALKTNLKSMVPRRQHQKREITLLSHGYSNPNAWPDGKLTVYPWDNTVDQWLTDNIRRVSKQDLVYGLLRQCSDLNGGNIDDFVADEINVVLLVSRALTTDGLVVYTATCPYCGSKKREDIKVPDQLEKVGEKKADYPGYDVLTLPECADVVKLRPLLVKDEKLILNRSDADRAAVPDAELRTLMRVVTINDSTPDTLDELATWFRALKAKDAKQLEDSGRAITPHLNTAIPHVCDEPECRRSFVFPLNFDQDFFR